MSSIPSIWLGKPIGNGRGVYKVEIEGVESGYIYIQYPHTNDYSRYHCTRYILHYLGRCVIYEADSEEIRLLTTLLYLGMEV